MVYKKRANPSTHLERRKSNPKLHHPERPMQNWSQCRYLGRCLRPTTRWSIQTSACRWMSSALARGTFENDELVYCYEEGRKAHDEKIYNRSQWGKTREADELKIPLIGLLNKVKVMLGTYRDPKMVSLIINGLGRKGMERWGHD